MESKQTGRVIFILIALAGAVWSIFGLGLKPGIDMVGGTSLLYQIKAPPGGYQTSPGHTLAEDVMAALKKRVDPEGVKNYIWRPQGADRLEIQIPASAKSDDAVKARDAYVAAQRQLDATDISDAQVINAVEGLSGPEQAARLDALSQGMPARKDLFAKLVSTYTAMLAAEKTQNADATAIASNAYDKLKSQIGDTNLRTSQLEDALGQKDPSARQTALAAFKKSAAGFPARLSAIDNFISTYNAYDAIKGSIADSTQLKRELQGSGVLAFHIQAGDDVTTAEYERMRQQLKAKGPRPQAGDKLQWFEVDKPEYVHDATAQWNGKNYMLCWITPEKSLVNAPGTKRWSMEKAYRESEDGRADGIGFQFDPTGGLLFHDLTSNNLKRTLVTLLDNKVLTAATIQSAIGDRGTLTSGEKGYSPEEMAYLIDTLNAGSLPAQLEDEPISEHTVGPQLGADNLRRGLYACAFGLVVVAVFLIFYYYVAGIVATFAVFMNVALILGILAAFGATFTLPGVAGIVLTIGAAVDANVLIFERLREEQHRGLGLRMAMRNAYSHAQTAIWDSNATTIITSLILYWLGSEEVKGFGITLLIGLCCSLFTSLFVTRTIFNILIDTFNVQSLGSFPLTFPKWDKLLKPDIDWMKLVPYFLIFSGIFIAAGTTAFIITAKNGQLADVDFSSGTQVQFDLKQGMAESDLRSLFDKANNPALPAVSLTAVAGNEAGKELPKTYEIITPNVDAKAVRTAVLDVLQDKVALDRASTFDHYRDPIETALNTAVLPIDKPDLTVKDFKVTAAEDYLGGAAIVLDNINPPLRLDQIRDRLENQRVQEQGAQSSGSAVQFHDFTVVSPAATGTPTSFAVVLTNDPAFPHDKDEAKWLQSVAAPMWQLTKDAINSEGKLQKVNNFDAQVAGDTQQAAIFSLVLSSLVIMAYIWFRFGNLKYGAATVLAMIHDVALVVGAVGLSHWIPASIGGLLLITPFRVNLTIVAAVLTVMSYSMIDTIVVFDRIRENRGKFGHLSRKIVNDSINQTLSRTLLTAGTTIVTVAGMYVLGGAGIHGFTFVLLIGILVGTYSSIAIAAPILLRGSDGRSGGSAKPKRDDQSALVSR
jgi:SecD/SecF fusion protein